MHPLTSTIIGICSLVAALVDAAPALTCGPESTSASYSPCDSEHLGGGVQARSQLTHPSGSGPGTIHLFHGTDTGHSHKFAPPNGKVDLGKGEDYGDFHLRNDVPGGFYMTDSLIAAAQFACYNNANEKPDEWVDVIELEWNGAGQNVKEFPSATYEYESFLAYNFGTNRKDDDHAQGPFKNDPDYPTANSIYQQYQMVTGPMNVAVDDSLLTKSFWQYAVINEDAAAKNLKILKVHKDIICKHVPVAEKLTDDLYAQSQFTNDAFERRLEELADGGY